MQDCLENPVNEEDYDELEKDTSAEKLRKRALETEWKTWDKRCEYLIVNNIAEDQLEYAKGRKRGSCS